MSNVAWPGYTMWSIGVEEELDADRRAFVPFRSQCCHTLGERGRWCTVEAKQPDT